VRRLTGDEHLSDEFASTWREYELDAKTSAMLAFASRLTDAPAMLDDSDFDALREAGWDDQGVYEITALTSLFNMSGRMEAASGLPPDDVPEGADIAEARPDGRS